MRTIYGLRPTCGNYNESLLHNNTNGPQDGEESSGLSCTKGSWTGAVGDNDHFTSENVAVICLKSKITVEIVYSKTEILATCSDAIPHNGICETENCDSAKGTGGNKEITCSGKTMLVVVSACSTLSLNLSCFILVGYRWSSHWKENANDSKMRARSVERNTDGWWITFRITDRLLQLSSNW